MPPNVSVQIALSEDERAQLEAWTRRRTSAQALAQRSRIVLAAAEGLRNTEIAERVGVSRNMAATWRSRFAEHRLDGLTDEPRPGRPRTITDEQVDAVIAMTVRALAQGRDALVDAVDGQGSGLDPDGGVADLASVRAPTASSGDLQAQPRPAVRRQGPRRRRALPQPARARGRALRRSRSPRSRRSTGPRRSCRCSRARQSAPRMTTGAPARRASTPPWTSAPARSSAASTIASRAIEFKQFLNTIDREVPGDLDVHLVLDNSCTQRPPRSRSGCSHTPAFVCTSRRRARPGSTSSSAGSENSPPSCSSAAHTEPSPRSTRTSGPG